MMTKYLSTDFRKINKNTPIEIFLQQIKITNVIDKASFIFKKAFLM